MDELEQRIIGVLEAVDEGGNALLGPMDNIPLAGNPHATISQRLGQMLVYGTPDQQHFAHDCDVGLTAIENAILKAEGKPPIASHCLDAIKDFPTTLPQAG